MTQTITCLNASFRIASPPWVDEDTPSVVFHAEDIASFRKGVSFSLSVRKHNPKHLFVSSFDDLLVIADRDTHCCWCGPADEPEEDCSELTDALEIDESEAFIIMSLSAALLENQVSFHA
jgi:hypothetical protein